MATFWNVFSWVSIFLGFLSVLTGHYNSLSYVAFGLGCCAMYEIEKLKK